MRVNGFHLKRYFMSDGKNTVPKSDLSLPKDEQSSEEDRTSRVKCNGTKNLQTDFYSSFWV